MASLWQDAWETLAANTRAQLTGKPVPGSREEKLGKLQDALLEQRMKEVRGAGKTMTPQEQLAFLTKSADAFNQLDLDRQKALLNVAGGESFIDLAGKKQDILDNSYITRKEADTTSNLKTLQAEGDQRLRLIGYAPGILEKDLANLEYGNGGVFDRLIAYGDRTQERAMKMQNNWSGPQIANFIGGLAATAAALFA